MRYFINADDFGINHSKTEAIDLGVRAGWIQRTSLIVNSEATAEACALARQHDYMDRVCFHLNLASGTPLTEAVKKTALCDGSGNFCKAKAKAIQKRCMSRRAILAIREECEAQMRAFRSLGFKSKHLDSHTWCLCNLPVWIAVKPLLSRYGFETTRALSGHRLQTSSFLMRLYQKLVESRMRKKLRILEAWSGCGREVCSAREKSVIGADSLIEWYVHPDMIDGVSTDSLFSYHKEAKPLEEVAKLASSLGQLQDCCG